MFENHQNSSAILRCISMIVIRYFIRATPCINCRSVKESIQTKFAFIEIFVFVHYVDSEDFKLILPQRIIRNISGQIIKVEIHNDGPSSRHS